MADKGKLTNVRICHSLLSDRIMLARFGKDPSLALDHREAQSDFWGTLISYGFKGKTPEPGEAVEISFGAGDEQYTCVLRRTPLGLSLINGDKNDQAQ